MAANPVPGPGVSATIRRWWKENSARDGFFSTLKRFFSTLWEFARDSTPSRRQQRYGDVEYDWDFRVDTTSATVGGRDRLLGMFHSPNQPTEPALFREMLASLIQTSPALSRAKVDFREFTFIDIGSGKGRALLMAADYPFFRIVGIELLPELHRVAKENLGKFKSDSQQCFAIDCVLGDACEFTFPPEPTVLYLFNPLPEIGLARMIGNLEQSLREHPRAVFVLYHNPLLEDVLAQCDWLRKLGGTHQYSFFMGETGSVGVARNAADSDRRGDPPTRRDRRF
jgi:SAM-dependent methyltransferase